MRKKLSLALSLTVVLLAVALISACAQGSPTQSPGPSPSPSATSAAPSPSPGQTTAVELTYSNFFPATHFNSVLAQAWIKEIETRTNGRVKITYYPGGTLTPAAKIFDGVETGISDIGMSVLAYTVGRFPASELVDLPHGYPNGWVATRVANDFYNQFKPAEFDSVHVFYFHAHGPGVIMTTKKPVRQLEDLEGLVIRSTGVGATIVKALGAEGYGAAQGEAYELMSKGTIDGSFSPREVLKGWNQAEVVKYVTGTYDLGYTADMFVVMNKAKWNSLPDDIKSVFTQVSQDWIDKHGMVWDYYDKVAIDHFLTFTGREVIELSPQEMKRWVDIAVKPLIDDYITQKTALKLPAADYQKYLVERVSYWSAKAPKSADSVAWVEKNVAPLAPAK